MASTWSDSRIVTSTTASAAETQIGNDINIPQNQTWLINGIYGVMARGGNFRIAVDSLPGMSGSRIANTTLGGSLSAAGAGSAEIYPANFVVQGPAVVSFFGTASDATSGEQTAMVNYQVTQG